VTSVTATPTIVRLNVGVTHDPIEPKGAVTMSTIIVNAKSCEQGRQQELTEAELANVDGGSGAGAGKVTFNPFSITRHVDKASPVLFL
jgi:type VI protein secretion system component Hcp